jgi:hypothetical protein
MKMEVSKGSIEITMMAIGETRKTNITRMYTRTREEAATKAEVEVVDTIKDIEEDITTREAEVEVITIKRKLWVSFKKTLMKH